MGIICAPCYAHIFITNLEAKHIYSYIKIYFHYKTIFYNNVALDE